MAKNTNIKNNYRYDNLLMYSLTSTKSVILGIWVAHLVEHWTFTLSSGLDLGVGHEFKPTLGFILGMEPLRKK